MRVADIIFKKLADYGVRDVFMISGGGAMFLKGKADSDNLYSS